MFAYRTGPTLVTTVEKLPSPLFDSLVHQEQATHQIVQTYPYPSDYQQAAEFIKNYSGNEATFNAYRREIERLLQWTAHVVKKSLCTLTQADIENYLHFCQHPPKSWISLKKHERFIDREGQRQPNPEWRPFVATISKSARRLGHLPDVQNYLLSQKTLKALFAILGSFFNYLIQKNFMGYNPVTQIRQKSKFFRQVVSAPIRRLSELQWSYVIETAEQLANADPLHERTLFIMNALYGMYLRISELAANERWQPQMAHFFRDPDGNWWFKTVGKGNKERQIAVSEAMLAALKRYRQTLKLPLTPSPGENQPLIRKNKGKGPLTSTRQLRDIVQYCFDAAIARMLGDGFTEEAEQLKAATVHWLRHTGISDDIKFRPREHVRDDAGHGSGAITDHYIDVELRERHASGKNKKIKPDN